MEGWILDMEEYVRPDLVIAAHAPKLATLELLGEVLGKKDTYAYEDARSLQKKQYSTKEYLELMDVPNGYSPNRMLEMLRARCRYLVERGATLNNPHIPPAYFKEWEKITKKHAQRLRELVRDAMKPN